MDPIKMLYNMHAQCTLCNPITHHKFSMKNINIDTDNLPPEIVNICMHKYKLTPEGKLYGSVDVDPLYWTKVFFASYNIAKQNDKSDFYVPNGCCNVDTCGIKKYYEVLYDYCIN